MSLSKISYNLYGIIVQQRICDGYFNATQLCRAHKELTGEEKLPKNWLILESTKDIFIKLSDLISIPAEDLTEVTQGKYGGTWLHPRLVIRFTMWLNNDFSLQVEDWIQKWFATEQNPVQISFSELNNLIGLLDTAIQAAEMTHTILHGLTYFLNRARENLEVIRNIQDTENIINNSIHQQQVDKAENRINNLTDRVGKLKMMNPSQESKVIQTIDLDINDYQKSKEAVWGICNTLHNSKLIKFLSIEPDEEDGFAPVLMRLDVGEFVIYYRKSGIQIKSVFILPNNDYYWEIVVDYNHIKNELIDLNNANISFDVNENKFYLKIERKTHCKTIVLNSIRETYYSDIDNFITDDRYVEFSKDIFKKLSLTEILFESNATQKYLCWNIYTIVDNIYFLHFSSTTIYQYCVNTGLKTESLKPFYLNMHKNIIDVVLSLDFSNIRIELEREYERALIILDENVYLLIEEVSFESELYCDFSSLYFWNRLDYYPVLNKNDFHTTIQSIVDADSEYINLKFSENEINIDSLDKSEIKNVSISTECSSSIVGSYCISAKLILKSLKYLKNDSMCLGLVEYDMSNFDFPNLFVMGCSNCTESKDSVYFWCASLGVTELSNDLPDSTEFIAEDESPAELKPIYPKMREAKDFDVCGLILEAVQESPNQRFYQLQGKKITPQR